MQNKDVHYKYAISYLLSIIILLIALAYYDIPNLVDKFSFALTLSSLLLAILAIFYTIISAHKQDSQFSKIIEATTTLNGSVRDINNAASSISLLTNDIPNQFKNINNKIDGMHISYKALSEIEQDSSESVKETSDNTTSFSLTKAIQRLQFNGMAVLYMFSVASRKSKSIEYSDFDNFEMADLDYAIGILNGFEVTELIDFKLHKECIVPTYCDQLLYTDLETELKRVVAVVNKTSSQELDDAMRWVDEKYA